MQAACSMQRPALRGEARSGRRGPRPGSARPQLRAAAAKASALEGGKYPSWDYIVRDLRQVGLRSVSPEEAAAAVEAGSAVLVDVRPAEQHESSHPKGAVSVPLFQILEFANASGPRDFLKLVAMKSQGVTPTQSNPAFVEGVVAAAGGRSVILLCEAGGTTEATVNFASGKPSRSLKAAWRVIQEGALPADRVLHLDRGALGYYKAGLPFDGEYDPSQAGSTPNAAEQPSGFYIDGEGKRK